MAEWVNGVIRSRQESTDSLDSSSARTNTEEYENSESEENAKDEAGYEIDDFSIIKTIGKWTQLDEALIFIFDLVDWGNVCFCLHSK